MSIEKLAIRHLLLVGVLSLHATALYVDDLMLKQPAYLSIPHRVCWFACVMTVVRGLLSVGCDLRRGHSVVGLTTNTTIFYVSMSIVETVISVRSIVLLGTAGFLLRLVISSLSLVAVMFSEYTLNRESCVLLDEEKDI